MSKTLQDYVADIQELERETEAATRNLKRAIAAISISSTSILNIALVGCGKKKVETRDAVRARDLYRGVPFRLAIRHAFETADDVHILSALHGLVDPCTHLVPYDFSMVELPPSQHVAWGKKVLEDLRAAYPMTRLKITFYAGEQYIRPIMRAITDESAYWTFENPLQGLDMYQRIAWFKDQERFWNAPF